MNICRVVWGWHNQRTWNHRLEDRFLLVQACSLSECSRNPAVSLTNWCCCERLCSPSVNFFEDFFKAFFYFMMGDLQVHPPTTCSLFSSFWPKMTWTLCPTLPIHLIVTPATFSFVCSPGWKSPQSETFCQYERGETETAEAPKGIKIYKFKNWAVEKSHGRCVASNGECIEGDCNLNM